MVEQLAYTQPVSGSIPLSPTNRKRERLWLSHGKRCHWCKEETLLVELVCRRQATIDHVIPRYKGGTNDPANLVSACRECNQRRNKEDTTGLAEGALLGKFRMGETKTSQQKVQAFKNSALNVLRGQRDQAFSRVLVLAEENAVLQARVAQLERTIAATTIRVLLQRQFRFYYSRVAQWVRAFA